MRSRSSSQEGGGVSSEGFSIDRLEVGEAGPARVGEQAGIAFGMRRQFVDRAVCDAAGGQPSAMPQRWRSAAMAAPSAFVAAGYAEDGGDMLVAFAGSAEVEADHVIEQQGVALAVRQVEVAAEAVRHRMHRTKAGVREGQSGLQAGQRHVLAPFDMLRGVDDAREIRVDQPDRCQRMDIDHRRAGGRDVGLDRVRQRIQPGACGQVGGIVVVVSGSTSATSGTTLLLMMAILWCLSVLLMIANWEISAAVPAVVGMQISGGPGRGMRSTPS